ncbi:MAG: hypothetical protein ACRCW5_06095 [Cetobacterium sp.]|uniref:hypothetical protein n=1 Tax=Cetobacterium sp. TaxID=2071632 RepID=UPI003F408CF4
MKFYTLILIFMFNVINSFSYDVISDSKSDDMREVVFTFNKNDLKETFGETKFEYYYEFPLNKATEILKGDIQNNDIEYLTIVAKREKKQVFRMTIKKSLYLKGLNLEKLTGQMLYKHYKVFGESKGLSFGTDKNNREQFDILYETKWN